MPLQCCRAAFAIVSIVMIMVHTAAITQLRCEEEPALFQHDRMGTPSSFSTIHQHTIILKWHGLQCWQAAVEKVASGLFDPKRLQVLTSTRPEIISLQHHGLESVVIVALSNDTSLSSTSAGCTANTTASMLNGTNSCVTLN